MEQKIINLQSQTEVHPEGRYLIRCKFFNIMKRIISIVLFVLLAGASNARNTSTPITKRNMNQGLIYHRENILSFLFHGYDPELNPDNVKVNVSLLLQSFKVVEERNVLESDVWISLEWNDPRLQWDARLRNCDVLRVNPKRLWKPDVSLYNSADSANQMNCWNSPIVLYSNGDISWINSCKLQSFCKFTLKTNPFEDQTCELKLGSWTFDGNAMDMALMNGEDKVQTDHLVTPPGWEYVSSSATRNSKTYPCCPEPYIDVTYNVTLRQLHGYHQLRKNAI